MSEREIQTIKKLLRKACQDGNDPYISLIEYRNITVSGLKESPAQLLMSRMLKSKLPTSASLVKPKVVENAQEKLKGRRDEQKMYYDRNAKPLPPFKERETVRIRKGKTWEPAIVTAKHTAPRSYIVITPDGTFYRRNRRHLLPTDESPPVITGPAYDEAATSPVAVTPSVAVAPPVAVTPQVAVTPPVAASNAESPGTTSERSTSQTPTKCPSSDRTVRLPVRFRVYIS